MGDLGLHVLLGLFSIPALIYLCATVSELGGGRGFGGMVPRFVLLSSGNGVERGLREDVGGAGVHNVEL